MFQRISEQLTAKAVENSIIDREEQEVLIFAYKQLLSFLVVYLAFLAIGLALGCFFATLVYCFLFCPLRMYAGGIHAGSYLTCTILSCIGFLLISAAALWYVAHYPVVYLLALYIPCCAAIWLLVPVPDPNKPLNEKETSHHKGMARRLILLETGILAAAFLLRASDTLLAFMILAPVTVSGMVVSGWVKNKRLGFA